VAVGDQLQTGYVTINTQVKPFTDVRVRRAVNMAIDKQRIIRIINNRAVPAVQVLPPLMPGYDKEYKGYVFDVAQAKKLLAEAGYPNGFSTILYANNTDPNPRIAQAIQQDLAAIGVKAELKTLAQSTVIEAGGTKGQAPLLWSGGMAWIADYPDPNDFYWPILSCASLSLGLVLQPACGEDGGGSRRAGAGVSGRRPGGEVPRDLPRGNAGCAVDPHLPREALHDAHRAHRGIAPVV